MGSEPVGPSTARSRGETPPARAASENVQGCPTSTRSGVTRARASSVQASRSARKPGRSVKSLASTANGRVTTHAPPLPIVRRATNGAPSSQSSSDSSDFASSGASVARFGAASSPRLRAASLNTAAAPRDAVTPFALVSPQATACVSTGSSDAPSGAAAARGPSATSATPPCSRNVTERVPLLGREPGRIVERGRRRTPRSPRRGPARREWAAAPTSSRSAESACSTIGRASGRRRSRPARRR